jgi:uncharacterized membrane protein YbjE (DUF340 family)
MSMTTSPTSWRDGVTRDQWLVLTIALLGWVFDVFVGQIFVSSMTEAMPSLLSLLFLVGIVLLAWGGRTVKGAQ